MTMTHIVASWRLALMACLAGIALTVPAVSQAALPAVAKSFSPNSIVSGGTSTLRITLTNPNATAITGVSFDDRYPRNLRNASPSGLANSCGGTATGAAGGTSLRLTGGTIPANGSCSVSVTVTASVAGRYRNRTGNVTSSAGTGREASATLTVTMLPPVVAKSFSPNSIASGGTSTLRITLTNPNAAAITGVSFNDRYPRNLRNASPSSPASTCGGRVTARAGASQLQLSRGTIPAGGSCSVSVTVTSSVTGSYLNSSGSVRTGNAGSGAAASATLTVTSGAPTSFNVFETGTAVGAIAGVIKTKVAGSAFGLDVVGIASGAQAGSFSNTVKVELLGNTLTGVALDANNCPVSSTLLQSATAAIVNGRSTAAFAAVSDAWRNVRVRVSYPVASPSVTSCSTDNFAIRPASFGNAAASDINSATAGDLRALANSAASGGNVHRAGQPFQIIATARNTPGAATANYSGNPTPTLTGCVLPGAGCVPGVLTASTWTAVSGVAKTLDATYSEVGVISMKLVDSSFAAVDAADGSTAAERNIESAVFTVGRFVPDHFDLAPASIPVFMTFNDTTCATRSFTYIGQPFRYVTVPQATIAAKNAAGGTTVNYRGPLWKLDASGVTPDYSVNPLSHTLEGAVGLATVTENAAMPGTGLLSTNAADIFNFKRTIHELPFNADISLSLSIGETSETAVAGNNIIETGTPAVFPTIAFDSGDLFLFGRLALFNAHGSETLGLPMPAETQVWNGAGFTRNTADFCTRLVAANVTQSNWQKNLGACESSVSLSGRFNAGRGNLRLSAPGNGNTGSVDLTMNLGSAGSGSQCVSGAAGAAVGASQSWLQGKGSGMAYDQNPVARGSFGLYRGNKPLIYIREMY